MAHKRSVWVKTMSYVIDLDSRRWTMVPTQLFHPAGVTLPLDRPSDAGLIAPEVRWAINSGSYSADLIQLLPDLVQVDDRVLVIGAGLGVTSTLIAKCPGVERVLAVEADTTLTEYLPRVHALNGVPWVETVNGIPALCAPGRVPFFVRNDIRASSLLPEDGEWRQSMLVPSVDLDLILLEEGINLIVCEIPMAAARILAEADIGAVERIAITPGSGSTRAGDTEKLTDPLAEHGFAVVQAGTTLLLDRDGSLIERSLTTALRAGGTGA